MRRKQIKIKYDVTGYPLVFDVKGNLWRLPFDDERGRHFKPKILLPFLHGSYPAYRINNRIISEKVILAARVENPRAIPLEK